ncbi:BTB/POZ domain-containing protein 16-like [Tubulanus polymorphus]|uniref:BTB/POZ domain-containing protein 16-like n=1 Tax=Tubulanus polymorphus TaxID=672921 RepID=UPI003DA38876
MADTAQRLVSSHRSGHNFPSIPPKPNKGSISYPRSVLAAPLTALKGVLVDGREQAPHPQTPRCRIRKMVGFSNRWRLPQSLGSDLLGSSQAIRAIKSSYNGTMIHLISAESPKMSMNIDIAQPYTFRVNDDKPFINKTSQETRHLHTAPPSMQRGHAPIKTFIPSYARPATPLDIFLYHSKAGNNSSAPDVLLRCLKMNWELHRPVVQKSEALSRLLRTASSAKMRKYTKDNSTSETLDRFVRKSRYYDSNGGHDVNETSVPENVEDTLVDKDEAIKSYNPTKSSHVAVIKLKITDPKITKQALAVALGNLYHEEVDVEDSDVAGVLAAAHALKFKALSEGCVSLMLKTINVSTVCSYHQTAVKYGEENLIVACERWLELNLVPKLSTQIYLRQLPYSLLQKVLNSSRLFTYNEYCLYKMLTFWLFLHLNPDLQLMPSTTTVKTYFNCLPKSSSFLEHEVGQYYAPLFAALRLHGVLDTTSIHDIKQMNILPQSVVVNTLMKHYYALQGGGDMSLMSNFNYAAVRYGFILEEEPHYVSEIFSIHGFHFELRAAQKTEENGYEFYMQRLKPNDPLLSFRECERHTFSLRPDRDVRYCITVQTFNKGNHQWFSTGALCQKFGLTNKTNCSEVLSVSALEAPLHVTFSLLFPPS